MSYNLPLTGAGKGADGGGPAPTFFLTLEDDSGVLLLETGDKLIKEDG